MPHSRVVFVDVFIDSVSPKRFRVLPSPKNDPQLPTRPTGNPDLPEIIFHNQRHPGFIVYFELQGDTHGYFFPTSEREAIWSQRGNDCPDETGVWQVFTPLAVYSSGHPPERRILKAWNFNPSGSAQRNFMYNLRVFNGSDRLDLDPPGDNTNGDHGFWLDVKSGTATALTVGGAVATAIFLGILLVTKGSVDLVGDVPLGALLISLTLGFGIAALLFRLVRGR